MAPKTTTQPEPGSAVHMMRYFGMPIGTFRAEFAQLTTTDKAHLKAGLADGSLTY